MSRRPAAWRYGIRTSGRERARRPLARLGVWGQRWLLRTLPPEQLDTDSLLWDMHRRVRTSALPSSPILVRFEIPDAGRRAAVRSLLLRTSEASLCAENPGFPEELVIRSPLRTLVAWWHGDLRLAKARNEGMKIEGRNARVRDFERWFERYLFADVTPANAAVA